MNLQTIALVAVAVAFGLIVLWRARPAMGGGRAGNFRDAVRKAQARVEAAKDDPSKALALCDAADACALAFGRSSAAVSYYLRAARLDPASKDVLERAQAGLARKPRALESYLWRRLGSDPWSEATKPTHTEALRALAQLYDTRLKNHPRAKALAHVADALK